MKVLGLVALFLAAMAVPYLAWWVIQNPGPLWLVVLGWVAVAVAVWRAYQARERDRDPSRHTD